LSFGGPVQTPQFIGSYGIVTLCPENFPKPRNIRSQCAKKIFITDVFDRPFHIFWVGKPRSLREFKLGKEALRGTEREKEQDCV
jgi:hypothetical protein